MVPWARIPQLLAQYEYYLKHDKTKLPTIFIKNETEYKTLKNNISVMENRYPSLKDSLVLRSMHPVQFSDGSIYSGALKSVTEQVPHGHGHIIFRNGATLEGEFKDGKLNGKGEFLASKDGKLKDDSDYNYKGEFKDGKFNGSGIWYNKSKKYEGQFLNDKWHGKGKITFLKDMRDFEKGVVMQGIFKDDNFDGDKKIKIYYTDGKITTFKPSDGPEEHTIRHPDGAKET